MHPSDFRLTLLAAEAKVRPSHIFHLLHALQADPLLDLAAFSTFAQLEAHHVERMALALRSSGLYPEGHVSKRRVRTASPSGVQKATRLPPAMQLPDEWLAYAQEKRQWDRATTEDVLADFIEHWSNRQDARAAKIDWFMTWQTWVRRDRRLNGTWSRTSVSDDPELRWITQECAAIRSSPRYDHARQQAFEARRGRYYANKRAKA